MASAGGGSSSSNTRDVTPKIYQHERGFILDELKNRIGGRVNEVNGPFVAGLTNDESSALSQFNENAFGAGGVGAAADQQIISTLGGEGANPFTQAAIEAATRPILQDAQLQELRDRANFTGSGQKIQGSTAFQENRNTAIRDTERNVGDVAAQISYQAHMQERQNQLQAVNLASSRLADQREGIATLALPRLIEQFGIDKGNEELQRRFQIIEQALLTMTQLTTPTPGGKSQGANGNVSIGG